MRTAAIILAGLSVSMMFDPKVWQSVPFFLAISIALELRYRAKHPRFRTTAGRHSNKEV